MTFQDAMHLLSTQGLAVLEIILLLAAIGYISKSLTPLFLEWLKSKRERYEQELKDQHEARLKEQSTISQERAEDKKEILELKQEVKALRNDLDQYRREDVTKMMSLLASTNEALQKNNELIKSNSDIITKASRHMDEQSEIIRLIRK